ncbi:MAG TPA: DUF1874 domain-containing protein [Patescibacteria group bacterium]|nr:DUF1874 domain-containing protein [Patescibacteria group bacterium]
MIRVANAFSLGMLECLSSTVKVVEVSVEEARKLVEAGFESIVGHANTAAVFSEQLGVEVVMNRVSVSLAQGD